MTPSKASHSRPTPTGDAPDQASATPQAAQLRPAPVAWVHVGHIEDAGLQKTLVTTALEQGFSRIVVPVERRAELEGLGRFDALWLERGDAGPGHRVDAHDGPVGRWVTLRSKTDEAGASALAGQVDHMVISATDWKVIPLENLIADYQPTGSQLLAEVTSAEEAVLMLNTLEVGTDGIVLSPREPQDVIDLARVLEEHAEVLFDLVEADVVRVEDAGNGERVCIDSCSLLRPGEGMLVGGSSQGLFLVHSESLESEYVNARPFRVNAGAVYAYVQGTAGRTHYLSEVHAGMPLVAVDHAGKARTVTVGRAKVETRPLLLVEAAPRDQPGRTYTVILQNAETIRLVTPDGGAVSVAELQPGDTVLLARSDAARHFGRPIKENILER